ncbi:MAG: universal stress protein [Candidatus Desulfofervidaceae bacterium]|nr:universal stress protein [Candidatus Desulfofervidaceae bacterium]
MKILVPVDGSKYALKAAKKAAVLAKAFGASVIIISVAPDIGLWELGYDVKEKLERQAHKSVEEAKSFVKEQGIDDVKGIILSGIPVAEGILKTAQEEKIDIITIGSRGLTGLTKFMLGSVAQKVVTHATCSVFVVK